MKPATKSAVKQIVKQVIDKRTEDKFVGGIVEPSVLHNAGISTGDLYPVCPPVAEGTAYNQRVGHKIRPKYIDYKVQVALNEQADLLTPYFVDIWVLTSKKMKSYNIAGGLGSIDMSQFLDGGQGNVYYDGSTMNALFPVNKELFNVVKHRRVRLSTTTQENHNSMASSTITFRLKCPKSLLYDTTNYPENYAPFTAVGFHRGDGTTPGQVNTPVTVTSYTIMYYEDA